MELSKTGNDALTPIMTDVASSLEAALHQTPNLFSAKSKRLLATTALATGLAATALAGPGYGCWNPNTGNGYCYNYGYVFVASANLNGVNYGIYCPSGVTNYNISANGSTITSVYCS
jgi:hypothetical protein